MPPPLEDVGVADTSVEEVPLLFFNPLILDETVIPEYWFTLFFFFKIVRVAFLRYFIFLPVLIVIVFIG